MLTELLALLTLLLMLLLFTLLLVVEELLPLLLLFAWFLWCLWSTIAANIFTPLSPRWWSNLKYHRFSDLFVFKFSWIEFINPEVYRELSQLCSKTLKKIKIRVKMYTHREIHTQYEKYLLGTERNSEWREWGSIETEWWIVQLIRTRGNRITMPPFLHMKNKFENNNIFSVMIQTLNSSDSSCMYFRAQSFDDSLRLSASVTLARLFRYS